MLLTRILCALLLLQAFGPAQVKPPVRPDRPRPKPVFSPPDRQRPGGQEQPGAATRGAKRPAAVDELDVIFARLRRWPARPAREAAVILAGLGGRVRKRLLEGLADNDWRIRSGSAFALAEMQATDALEPLVRAIRDPSNRAGLGDLFIALVKLDPTGAPRELLPFLTHSSSRIRRAALRALPQRLDARFVPDLLQLTRNRKGSVRESALMLLARTAGAAERDEFFAALGDPEARVASVAARHLGLLGSPSVRTRLLEMARSAPLRRATYALLAIVEDEDATGRATLPEKGPVRGRVLRMLKGRDPFYRGAAAVVLANLSFRSEDPVLRKLADEYLVSILLYSVAGGVFYPDYASLQVLCMRKLALLSGVSFGNDALRWKDWWAKNARGFTARRELRSLMPEDMSRCVVQLTRGTLDGAVSQTTFTGRASDLGSGSASAPLVLGARERERLRQMVTRCGFFKHRGEVRDDSRADGWIEVGVRVGPSVYRRFHHAAGAQGLRPLYGLLDELRTDLAWQRFIGGKDLAGRLAALEREQEFFARERDEHARKVRVLELALSAYPQLDRGARKLAVAVFRTAPRSWLRANAPAVGNLLRAEKRLNSEAVAIISMLASDHDPGLREVILDVVASAGGVHGRRILGDWVNQQPMPVVVRLMNDERAVVRAAAYGAAPRFGGQARIVDLLIEGLKDLEPKVREACINSLAVLKDDRILTLLESVLKGEDEAMRMRAIPALARVGKGQVVPRLMELYREGESRTRWAVVRALRDAGGRRAIVALAGIVRGSGPVEMRREALEMLVSLGGTDVADRLVEILERSRERGIKILLIGALPRVLKGRAVARLLPFLTDEDRTVARAAAINVGRLGAREAMPRLLDLLQALEGDAAGQRALEALTFHVARDAAPAQRHQDFKRWIDSYGSLTRLEWFLLEARGAGVALDDEVDWMQPGRLSRVRVMTLLRLMERGNAPLRMHAEKLLLAASGLPLEPLPHGAGKGEARDRADVYRRWARDLDDGR